MRSLGSGPIPIRTPTGLLVILSVVGCLIWRTSLLDLTDLAVFGKPGSHWWRLVTAPFTYDNIGYAFITVSVIALFGWLLERRHGCSRPCSLFAIGGIGGTAASAAFYDFPVVLGANGAALAMVCAWAVPDLLSLRAGEDVEGDLIGALRAGRRRGADAAGRRRLQLDFRRRRDHRRVRPRLSGSPGCARSDHSTLIVPGGPPTSDPITGPGTIAARPRVDRDEQTAGGHRIAHQPAPLRRDAVGEPRERLRVVTVAPGAARHGALGRVGEQLEHSIDRRDGGRFKARGDTAGQRKLVQVPQQTEAGDVGESVGARGPGGFRSRAG